MDLVPRESVWHVVFGWLCWAIPLAFLSNMLWIYLASKEKSLVFKIGALVLIGLLFLTAASASVHASITRQRQAEQEEVKRNIVPSVLPPLTENIMESVFSVTNKSSRTTISSGQLFCGINQILGENQGRPVRIGRLSSAAVPNAYQLLPGDSRSEPCLMLWSTLVQKVQCADMDLWMEYAIEPQPRSTQRKRFRLVGYQSRGGSFNWYPEPASSDVDYCDYFRRQTAPPI